jgi:lysozyme
VIKVCAKGPTLKGLDISHYQEHADWKRVRSNGFEFVFVKASEGVSGGDRMFHTHRSGAKMAGLYVGAYHFFHPKHDPSAQAQFFMRTVGMPAPLDLPMVMDWETTDNMPSAADRESGLLFLKTLHALTMRVPIIYGSPYFLQELALDQRFAKYRLWIAHYGTDCPLVPRPWAEWTFHQTSDRYPLPGIGACDVNQFNGTLEQLRAL